MAFALHTAARPVAVLDLKWEQVDFEANVIYFNPAGRPQTNKKRPMVRMSAELKEFLLAARDEALEKAKRLDRPVHEFVIDYGGYVVGSIRRVFRNTAREAGFIDVTPYTLRHTAATWMAQAGVDLWQIAGYIGTAIKMVEKQRKVLNGNQARPTRAEVLAARTSATPQLHHSRTALPNSEISAQVEKSRKSAEK
jgi:integrase